MYQKYCYCLCSILNQTKFSISRIFGKSYHVKRIVEVFLFPSMTELLSYDQRRVKFHSNEINARLVTYILGHCSTFNSIIVIIIPKGLFIFSSLFETLMEMKICPASDCKFNRANWPNFCLPLGSLCVRDRIGLVSIIST